MLEHSKCLKMVWYSMYLSINQPRGIEMKASAVIYALKEAIKNNRFDSEEELSKEIDGIINEIANVAPELIEQYRLSKECNHEYRPSTFTVQKRIFSFVTVYQRVCDHCQHTETHTEKDGIETPSWTKGATQRYYNNDI